MIKAHLFGGQEDGRVVEVEKAISELKFTPDMSVIDWGSADVLTPVEFIIYKFDKMLSKEDAAYILKEG